MKRLMKRLAAAMLSAACVTGTAVPMSPGAVTTDYDPCDVNHSGSVNIMDVLALNRYLLGDLKATDYNRFDANRDMVVDGFDSDYISHMIVGDPLTFNYVRRNVSGSSYSETLIAPPDSYSFEADNSANGGSRTYRRYSYLTHQEMSQYTLTLSPTALSNQVGDSPNIVIGTDDRYRTSTKMSEVTGIVNIGSNCTGFIVGDHEIATAAHCVYNFDEDVDDFYNEVQIYLYNSSGIRTTAQLTAIEAHMPVMSVLEGLYDYALITVEEDLSAYPHFDLGELCSVSDFADIPVYVTGAPSEVHNAKNSNFKLYSGMGHVVYPNNNNEPGILHYNIDTSGGDSGSPVYTIKKYTSGSDTYYVYTALGIHTFGNNPNYGARFTRYHLQFYRSNPYASHENNTI